MRTWSTASLGAILGGFSITRTANPALVYSVIGLSMGIVSLLFWWSPVKRGEALPEVETA